MYPNNVDASPYEPHLKAFINAFVANHPCHPDRVWMDLFRLTQCSHRGMDRLLGGEFSEFLPHVDSSALYQLTEMYDHMIVNARYVNFSDVKFGDFNPDKPGDSDRYQKCEVTGKWTKRPWISKTTVGGLDALWKAYYGYKREATLDIPLFQYVFAHLLNITLHLEWCGYVLESSFDEKWEQVKNWPDSGIMGPRIIDAFLVPDHPRYPNGRGTDISNFLPVAWKRRLYTEAWEVYNTKLDPEYHGPLEKSRIRRKGYHAMLAAQVVEKDAELFDSSFLAPFLECYKERNQ